MPEKAIISHRGEKYEIGRGKRFYGIWVVGAPYEAPVDRWPETRDGWEQAWTRFATVEVPGTIAPVQSKRSGLGAMLKSRRAPADGGAVNGAGPGGVASEVAAAARRGGTALLVGEGLLVLGVVLGLAAVFPAYWAQSMLSQGDLLVPHLSYVIAWAVSAGVIALSVSRPRTARLAALFALGLSTVTFGLFLSDLGEVTSGGEPLGSGLVISLIGWLACTVGAAIALLASCRDRDPAKAGPASGPGFGQTGFGQTDAAKTDCGWPGRPSRAHLGPLALLVLAGIGTAAAFAPSWDSYTITQAAAGTVQTVTEGNAFSNPGVVIAGNVAVMAAVVVVAVLAALWRPARQGALLLAGAIIPLAAEIVAALIQVSGPAYGFFGLTQAQAAQEGVTITSAITPIFWVYCVFVISLLVSCAWLLTAPGRPATPVSPWTPSPFGDAGRAPADPAPEPVGDTTDPTDTDPADQADQDRAGADRAGAEPSDTAPADTTPADTEATAGTRATTAAPTGADSASDSALGTAPDSAPAGAEGHAEGGQSAYA